MGTWAPFGAHHARACWIGQGNLHAARHLRPARLLCILALPLSSIHSPSPTHLVLQEPPHMQHQEARQLGDAEAPPACGGRDAESEGTALGMCCPQHRRLRCY